MTANVTAPLFRGPGASSPPRVRLSVLYATREGNSHRVATRIANTLRARGAIVDLEDVVRAPADVPLRRYAAVVIVASTHLSRPERAMVDFVAAHRRELNDVHTALVAVSPSEPGGEMVHALPEQRAHGEVDANATIESFCAETDWRPERIQPVAGARYSQYGFVVRFHARPIAKKTGGSTDARHDVEYTDWAALDHFVEDVSDAWVPVARGATSAAPA